MEERRGRLEELKELEILTKQLNMFVETGWKEAEKEPLASRLKTQVGIVATYKDKLQTNASALLEFCKDLMTSETDFMLANYFQLCDLCETVRNDVRMGLLAGFKRVGMLGKRVYTISCAIMTSFGSMRKKKRLGQTNSI